jgi:hypothetical protein
MKSQMKIAFGLGLGLSLVSLLLVNPKTATPVDASSPYYYSEASFASLAPITDKKIQLNSQAYSFDWTAGAKDKKMDCPYSAVYSLTDTDTTARNLLVGLPYLTTPSNLYSATPSYPSIEVTKAGVTTTIAPNAVHLIDSYSSPTSIAGVYADAAYLETAYANGRSLLIADDAVLYHYVFSKSITYTGGAPLTITCATSANPIGLFDVPRGVTGSSINFGGDTAPELEAYADSGTANFNFYSTQKLEPTGMSYTYWDGYGSYHSVDVEWTGTLEPTETTTFLAYLQQWAASYSAPVDLFKDQIAALLHHLTDADGNLPHYYNVCLSISTVSDDYKPTDFVNLIYTIPLTGGETFAVTHKGTAHCPGDTLYTPYVFHYFVCLANPKDYVSVSSETVTVTPGTGYLYNGTGFVQNGSTYTYTYDDSNTTYYHLGVYANYCSVSNPTKRDSWAGLTAVLNTLLFIIFPIGGLFGYAQSSSYVIAYVIVGICLLLGLTAMTVVLIVENSDKKKKK